jgi:hypothetical protein
MEREGRRSGGGKQELVQDEDEQEAEEDSQGSVARFGEVVR